MIFLFWLKCYKNIFSKSRSILTFRLEKSNNQKSYFFNISFRTRKNMSEGAVKKRDIASIRSPIKDFFAIRYQKVISTMLILPDR